MIAIFYLHYFTAENPQNIKNIISNSKVNDGVFEANIYIHGEPVKIKVDDSFPVANVIKNCICWNK